MRARERYDLLVVPGADVQRVRPAPRGSRGCGRAARVRARGRRTGARAEGGASCRCRTHRSPSGSPGPPRRAAPACSRASRRSGRSSTASSSSTGTRSTAGSPRRACRGSRRATSTVRAPRYVEDAPPVREGRARGRRVPPLGRAGVPRRSERRNELPLSRACERRRRGSAARRRRRGTGAEHARSVVAGDLCLDVPLGATAPDVFHVDASEWHRKRGDERAEMQAKRRDGVGLDRRPVVAHQEAAVRGRALFDFLWCRHGGGLCWNVSSFVTHRVHRLVMQAFTSS